jgi:transitional endoplasmic reticulum ATPase
LLFIVAVGFGPTVAFVGITLFLQQIMESCEKESEIVLTPAQQAAAKNLLASIPVGDVLVLRADYGMGKTTVLRNVHAAAGGAFVGVRQFMEALKARQPAAIEEAFFDLIEGALANHDLVIVDDLHLVTDVVDSCEYPRSCLLNMALTAILGEAAGRKKKLLFGVNNDDAPSPIRRRAYSWSIEDFGPEDYEGICRAYLEADAADRLDYAKIHRFAPKLNAHQLRSACGWVRRWTDLDTDRFVEYLRSQFLTSNVEIEEVEPVDWNDLKGVDDVIQALEAKIALPFENDALAAELDLKPKRGVLLAGPPGTGKTTIGRALAHRLKGKFFLIDGTVIAGSADFYRTLRQVFKAAKNNAPSVIFIDDTDVIFEGDEERGFYRYLLTMLDGLESASAERVCVMMTAMDISSLPAAMLRSGRVELWLETRLPDEEARAVIIREKLSKLPHPIGAADAALLASASRGLTGADLKAVVEDGKLLFAYDKAKGKLLHPAEDYFLQAIDTIRSNRRKYGRTKPTQLMDAAKVGFNAE